MIQVGPPFYAHCYELGHIAESRPYSIAGLAPDASLDKDARASLDYAFKYGPIARQLAVN